MFNIKKYVVSMVFGLALLGCLQPAFAADCKDLLTSRVTFDMTANGHDAHGTLWKTGSNGNIITVKGSLVFSPGETEQISGKCEGRRLSFTRSKPGEWIQKYTGMLKSTGSPYDDPSIAGTFSHVKPFSGGLTVPGPQDYYPWCGSFGQIIR